MDKCLEHVSINPAARELMGSARQGTAFCTLTDLERLLGTQHGGGDNNKITAEWYIETPRGRVTIRDYWHNYPNEQSICAFDRRAVIWAVAYLRKHKIVANTATKLARPR